MVNKPLPSPAAWDEGFWTNARRGVLSVQRCQSCGRLQFYPRPVCVHCFGRRLEWHPISGRGRVLSFTFVHAPVHPAFQPEVPIILAEIELAEGVRMLSRIVNCEPADLTLGKSVSVVFLQTAEEAIRLPHFEPAE
jgi:uncharacterized OB-fold protein